MTISPPLAPAVPVSMRTVNDSDPPAAIGPTSGSMIVKPAGTDTPPTVSGPLPVLKTVNVRVGAVPLRYTEPKLIGAAWPSGMPVLPRLTAMSGICGGAALTVAVTLKLNGFSSESLLANEMLPVNVPATPVSTLTVNDSLPPGWIGPTSGSMTVKPAGTETEPTDRTSSPSLRTVNVRV